MADFNIRNSFKLVTDVSQWGLLTWPAQSRARLVVTTMGMTLLAVAGAYACAEYILHHSSSVMLNLLLITGNMMLVLITAYLQTVLVGDLFFTGDWREQVFLGKKEQDQHEDSVDITGIEDHNAEFIIILCLAIAVNAVGLNLATGDFYTEYHEEGFFRVQMRADNPDERMRALNDIADPINSRLWDREGLRELIIEAFDDPDSDVRQRAMWVAGELRIRRARETLREIALEHDDPDTRAKAAFSLGSITDDGSYPDPESREVVKQVLAGAESDTVRIGALRGLAMMKDHRAVDTVLEHIDADNNEVMAHAFWALRRIGSDEARDELFEILDRDSDHDDSLEYCGAAEAFKTVASEEDVDWAWRQFRRTDTQLECEEMTFQEPDETLHRIIYPEPMRAKWLKAVGNQAPRSYRRELQRVATDPEEHELIRQVAGDYIRLLDQHR